jgi:Asp-tRNA(Asn)/Glu-tRNA(Gln) amidotransferase C subunit
MKYEELLEVHKYHLDGALARLRVTERRMDLVEGEHTEVKQQVELLEKAKVKSISSPVSMNSTNQKTKRKKKRTFGGKKKKHKKLRVEKEEV